MNPSKALFRTALLVSSVGVGCFSLVGTAGALAEPENTVEEIVLYPSQSECAIDIEYGEYIETAYASGMMLNSACEFGQAQVVYAIGSNLYGGPINGSGSIGTWYQSTAPYQEVFGANYITEFYTVNYGVIQTEVGVTPFG